MDDLDLGRPRTDGDLPRHGERRQVRPHELPPRRDPPSSTRSTRTSSHPLRAPSTGSQFALSGGPADFSYKRLAAHDHGPGGRRDRRLHGHPRHRDELGLLLRRGPHGRPATRLDDAARRQRPLERRHGLLVPVRGLAGDPPVPGPLPDRDPATRTTGSTPRAPRPARPAPGRRRPATAAAPSRGSSTSAPSPARTSSCRSPTPATRPSRRAASSSTTSSSPPARAARRSRPTRTRSTAGPSPGRRPAARATTTTGSSGPRPTRRHRPARSRPASFAREPEILALPRRQLRPVPVLGGRRDRGRRRGPRLRARDPDATDLRPGLLRRPDRQRRRRRPRERPPVVRRQPGRRALAAHLAQRGLRDLRRVAVERARGPGHGAGELRLLLRRLSPRTTRSGPWRSAIRGRDRSSTSPSTPGAR